MDKLFLLTDYKGRFGSKHDDFPYRSGMDLEVLVSEFRNLGYEAVTLGFSNVDPGDGSWPGRKVLYTSAEDTGLVYKQYIEDIVLALAYAGADVIPRFEFLRANNNKVFMELLRDMLPDNLKGNLVSSHFGTLEELEARSAAMEFPVIVKNYYGSMGRNVFLARSPQELYGIVRKRIASKSSYRFRIKEYLRQIKHKGYKRDSFYRGRFVVQPFIPGLNNDWKVYYFGDKAFVFNRPVFPEREFRASGGGYDNYKYGLEAEIPRGLLDFGWQIFRQLNVPNASMDIAWDGSRFYLLEFQCIYFGTAGILRRYSPVCWVMEETAWKVTGNEGCIEKVYADSIAWFTGKDK
jgi:hypothetical protein